MTRTHARAADFVQIVRFSNTSIVTRTSCTQDLGFPDSFDGEEEEEEGDESELEGMASTSKR